MTTFILNKQSKVLHSNVDLLTPKRITGNIHFTLIEFHIDLDMKMDNFKSKKRQSMCEVKRYRISFQIKSSYVMERRLLTEFLCSLN